MQLNIYVAPLQDIYSEALSVQAFLMLNVFIYNYFIWIHDITEILIYNVFPAL